MARNSTYMTQTPRVVAEPPPSGGTRAHGALKAVARPDWKLLGACRKEPLDLFFGDGQQTHAVKWTNLVAKKICARCKVQDECLAYALENREPYGVFGGLTPKERGRMLNARDALRRGTA